MTPRSMDKTASRGTCTCVEIAGENPDCAIHGIAAVISDLRQRSDGASHSAADWLEQYADDRRHSLRSLSSDSVSDGSKGVNIGMIAHIDHGKTSLTAAITRVLGQQAELAPQRELPEIVERLREGLVLVGESESDEGTIELFDTDAAETTMAEAADFITSQTAEVERVRNDYQGLIAQTIEQLSEIERLKGKIAIALDSGTGEQQPVALPDRCPHCDLHWGHNPPAIISGTDNVRCIECKTVFPTEPKAGVVSYSLADCKRLVEVVIEHCQGPDWDCDTKAAVKSLYAALNGGKP